MTLGSFNPYCALDLVCNRTLIPNLGLRVEKLKKKLNFVIKKNELKFLRMSKKYIYLWVAIFMLTSCAPKRYGCNRRGCEHKPQPTIYENQNLNDVC